jgi:hypothetical protein
MQDQGSCSPQQTDDAIMGLLLGEYSSLWTVAEIEREIGDPVATQDSLAGLYGAGLVHRLGDFVFPTRAAVRAARL